MTVFAEYTVLRNFLFYSLFVNFDPQKKITTEVMILKTEGLKRLVADAALRERMKENLGSVTDGKGAERIAGEIMGL